MQRARQLKFDVFHQERFVCTMTMPLTAEQRVFGVSEEDITEYVVQRLPTYKNKKIYFQLYLFDNSTKRNSNGLRRIH